MATSVQADTDTDEAVYISGRIVFIYLNGFHTVERKINMKEETLYMKPDGAPLSNMLQSMMMKECESALS